MKNTKFFAYLLSAAMLAPCFTACHDDDDDEDGLEVSNFDGSVVIGASTLNKVSDKMNVSSCYFTDNEFSPTADYYTFSTWSTDTIALNCGTPSGSTVTMSKDGLKLYGENAFYGGFCPTWFTADSEEDANWFYAPACEHYNNGASSAVICNPGLICRAMFSRHMAFDVSSAITALKKLQINSLYVCPSQAYNYIGDEEMEMANALPANTEIQFVVYGYVEDFSISNIKDVLKALTSAGSSIAKGGKVCAHPVTLASTDANGKLTVNKEWQKMDLTDLCETYIFEAALRVVDNTGKVREDYKIGTSNGEENEWLNYVLISDVAFTSRGLF